MAFDEEWLKGSDQEYEKAEKKEIYFSALCSKVDELLSIIEEKVIEQSKGGHSR
jgi:hypothetical protein